MSSLKQRIGMAAVVGAAFFYSSALTTSSAWKYWANKQGLKQAKEDLAQNQQLYDDLSTRLEEMKTAIQEPRPDTPVELQQEFDALYDALQENTATHLEVGRAALDAANADAKLLRRIIDGRTILVPYYERQLVNGLALNTMLVSAAMGYIALTTREKK